MVARSCAFNFKIQSNKAKVAHFGTESRVQFDRNIQGRKPKKKTVNPPAVGQVCQPPSLFETKTPEGSICPEWGVSITGISTGR